MGVEKNFYVGRCVCDLRFGTNKDVIGSFFAGVRNLGGRRLSGAGDTDILGVAVGFPGEDEAGTIGFAMRSSPGKTEIDFSIGGRRVFAGAEDDGKFKGCGR